MTSSAPTSDAASQHAHDLMRKHPFIDAHNDLAWVIRLAGKLDDLAGYNLAREHPETDTDIPRLRHGHVATQIWAAYLPTLIAHPATVTLEQIDVILRMEQLHADAFHPIRAPSDVATARARGKIGSVVAVEGTVGLEGSLAPLRLWQRLGVRLVTLCHNETLPWIDSATDKPNGTHGGLSEFGVKLIAEMNRLGLLVDLAHVAPHAMHKVLDAARAPIVISHSNATALCPHPRNTPDDVLARLPQNGGVVMATFVPKFLSSPVYRAALPYQDAYGKHRAGLTADELSTELAVVSASWEKSGIALVCDHLEHFRAKVGEDHIGIGSDFYGGPTPPGLENVSKFPDLIAELVRRGWRDEALVKLMGGNFLRVWQQVLDQAQTS